MKLLRNEQQKSRENAKEIKTICKEKFENKNAKDKKYCNIRDYYYYTGEYIGLLHSICNSKYTIPK